MCYFTSLKSIPSILYLWILTGQKAGNIKITMNLVYRKLKKDYVIWKGEIMTMLNKINDLEWYLISERNQEDAENISKFMQYIKAERQKHT